MSQTARTPLPPPKTSIFDITLNQTPESLGLEADRRPSLLDRLPWRRHTAAPEPEAESEPVPLRVETLAPEPAKLPLRPKTSIFDITLTQIPVEIPAPKKDVKPTLLGRLGYGKPTLPLESEVTKILVSEPPVVIEAPKVKLAPRPVVEKKIAMPAPLPAPVAAPMPPLPAAAPLTVDEDEPWDQGTAVEWHPSLAGRLFAAPEKASPVAPLAQSKSRLLMVAVSAALLTCLAGLGTFLWLKAPAAPPPAAAVEMPEDLKVYFTKAQAGDVTAMRMLGLRYCYGIAAPLDSREGVKWLRKAAASGNVPAQKELAAMGYKIK